MPQEIELKLVILDNQHQALFDHPTVLHYQDEDSPVTFDVLNTYYDSPNCDFLKANAAVRVRENQDEILQTIKGKGAVNQGLHARFEETAALSTPHLDLGLIQDKDWQKTLSDIAIHTDIQPVFTTHFSRTRWLMNLDQQTQIELVLDMGEVCAGEQNLPIYEIELELIKGQKAYALYQIAADLAQTIPLALQPRSKAWWGYKLYHMAQHDQALTETFHYDAQPAAFFMEQAEKLYRNSA